MCRAKPGIMVVDGDRNTKELPGSPDPRSDLLLYRPPQDFPGSEITPDDDTEIFVHAVAGDADIYYLRYPSGPAGRFSIMPFESRLDAAAFILGKEDMQLARLAEPDRNRIRSHFPEFFQDGE